LIPPYTVEPDGVEGGDSFVYRRKYAATGIIFIEGTVKPLASDLGYKVPV
jgi:hypothetical protein